ncbi:MAG: hypothetical protein P8L44_19225 [Opitutales bacterium]|nr:hypothetical protein [Opitutales bacterium]
MQLRLPYAEPLPMCCYSYRRLCSSGDLKDNKALPVLERLYVITDTPVNCFNRPIVCLALVSKLAFSTLIGAGGFGIDCHVYQTAYSFFDLNTGYSSSIIGAWQFGNSNGEGSGVVVFMKDGTFYLIEDGDYQEGDVDGFERGTYTWNESSGIFLVSVEQDANGEAGLSHPNGNTTVSISNNQLTCSDSEGSIVLTRVIDEQ